MDSVFRSPADLPPSDAARGFRCEVNLPAFSRLAESDPSDVIAIRSELGHGYMYALRKWQMDPTEANQETVEMMLKEYCQNISLRYAGSFPNTLEISFSSGRFITRAKPFIDVGAKMMNTIPLFHTIKEWGEIVIKIIKTVRDAAAQEKATELEITTARDVQAIGTRQSDH